LRGRSPRPRSKGRAGSPAPPGGRRRILSAEVTQEAAALAAAERALTLAKNRYQGGIATYLEVITAGNAALANQRTAAALKVRQMTASVNLIKALGGGWDAGQLPRAGSLVSK
jgi:outer membrane protein TolC